MHQPEYAIHVDGEQAVPRVRIAAEHIAADVEPGVGENPVESSEARQHLVQDTGHFRSIGEIDGQRKGVGPEGRG